MQGTVETRNLIRQFFDEPQISDEDLDSLAKVVDKRDSMLPIEELQRLIELLGESQTLLGAGKFRFINETRQSLWKATVNLFKLRLLSIATNSAPDERRCDALRQLSQMEVDEEIIVLFDKIANDPTTPEKVAKVAKEAKQGAISFLDSTGLSEDEMKLSVEEAEAFEVLNSVLDTLIGSLDRLTATIARSADDYAAAADRMERRQ